MVTAWLRHGYGMVTTWLPHGYSMVTAWLHMAMLFVDIVSQLFQDGCMLGRFTNLNVIPVIYCRKPETLSTIDNTFVLFYYVHL